MGEGRVFVDYGQWRPMTGLRPINALAPPNISTQAFCGQEIRILSR
jgi:hypothetical protein